MRNSTLAVTAAVLAVTISGCNRKAESEAPAPVAVEAAAAAPQTTEPTLVVADGFHHQAGLDASGYYLSPEPIRIGNFELSHLGVGAPSDFQTWEKGDHGSTFGPILIEFSDTTSPKASNEMGGGNPSVTLRVLPEAYSFNAGKLTFRGRNAKLGEVVFSGTFDQAALARARSEGSGQDTVLKGELKVGNQPVQPVSLFYWAGD
ncbi:MAG: hypothetical protein Q8L66_11770 [Caulobacter sp.]|nr:hypothetical protein [Caulobacter sp.]